MVTRANGLSPAKISEIRELLKQGLSGSNIAKKVHIRKETTLSEVRKIRGSPKHKKKATVKGKGSQTKLRKAKQQREHKTSVKRVSEFQRPKARFYAIITSIGKFNYPVFSQKQTNTLTPSIYDMRDLEQIDQILYDLTEEGKEPFIDYIDLKSGRKVTREYVQKRL